MIRPITFDQWKQQHPVIVKFNSESALIELYARYRESHAVARYFNLPPKRSLFAWWFQGNRDVLDKPENPAPPDADDS